MANIASPNWLMADRLAGGHLADIILELRGDLSWRQISLHLRDMYGIEATDITLAEWYRQLAADEEAAS